jgi:hypothetical protein
MIRFRLFAASRVFHPVPRSRQCAFEQLVDVASKLVGVEFVGISEDDHTVAV